MEKKCQSNNLSNKTLATYLGNKGRFIVNSRSLVLLASIFVFEPSFADCSKAATQGKAITCLQNQISELSATIQQEKNQKRVVPKGAVVAFNSDACPKGWAAFDQARGRVIVGTGRGKGLTGRILGDIGGEEVHTLTLAELPSHKHTFTGNGIRAGGWGGTITTDVGVGDHVTHRTYIPSGNISATVGGGPHNNMPPYIALKLCIKK